MTVARGDAPPVDRHPLRTAARLVVPLALLALLWRIFDGQAGLERLAGASPLWLLAAIVAAQVQTVLSALRWRLTAGRLGLRIATPRAIGEYFLAQIVNLTLPGGVVGDAARIGRHRHSAGLEISAQAVVIERLAGQIALAVFALAGFLLMVLDTPRPGLIAATAGLVALTAILWRARHALGARLARLPVVARFGGAIRAALLARDILPRQITLGVAIVACNLAAFAFCARATGTTLGPVATLTLVPLILTAMLLPLSVGGWGWREAAAAALFPLAGATADAGLAASVAFGLAILLAAAPGAVWPLVARDRRP